MSDPRTHRGSADRSSDSGAHAVTPQADRRAHTDEPRRAEVHRGDSHREHTEEPRRAEDHRGDERRTSRDDLVAREKAEFGGMRFFLAFFGWLAATGAVVLLTAIVTGALAAIGVRTGTGAVQSGSGQAVAAAVGIAVLAFVLFVGYYIGGYVAGRMARFSGLKQGFAVWLWAVIIAVLVAIAGAIVGSSSGAFNQIGNVSLPISGSTASATGIWSLIVAIVFSLLGALVGGLGGMRFHRKVDRFAAQA